VKMEIKSRTFKIIGVLMAYPSQEAVQAIPDMRAMLKSESWVPHSSILGIEELMNNLSSSDILDMQEDYVALFDRTPSLSLHLFEHVHGDSRDRGQAMVELDLLYREKGLGNSSEHTPDYLPLFLEYLSMLPVAEAQSNLDGAIDVIAAIGERLKKRGSAYASLFDALKCTASCKPDEKKLLSALRVDAGDEVTQEQMDQAWEEQFAFDKAGEAQNGGCPKASDMLARMGIPASEKEGRS
jgi:nitrate reductase molybdenum cofactor assembly chaperone NarJ/NarW